jgi:hypothetical protein
MALFKGTIVGAVSGKMAGTVFSHNAGGQYMRQLTIPTNPNTALQNTVRTNFGNSSIAWRDVLTAGQRAAWDSIAPSITAINALGDAIQLTGQQAYVRAASLALLAGEPPPAVAPITTGNTDIGTLTLTSISATTVTIGVAGAPAWAADDDGYLLVFVGRAVGPARNYYRGPYQFAAGIAGDTSVPITTGTAAFTSVVGQRRFVRCIAYLGGRVSQSVFLGPAVVA